VSQSSFLRISRHCRHPVPHFQLFLPYKIKSLQPIPVRNAQIVWYWCSRRGNPSMSPARTAEPKSKSTGLPCPLQAGRGRGPIPRLPVRIGLRRQVVSARRKLPDAKLTRIVDLRRTEALKLSLTALPDGAKNIDVRVGPGIAVLISDEAGDSRGRHELDAQIGQVLPRGDSQLTGPPASPPYLLSISP
jgi:hypothetical protein